MSILNFKGHRWVKIVASFLVVAFINQDVIWAQDTIPASSNKGLGGNSFFKSSNVNASINIPKNIASVRENWSPAERSMINDKRLPDEASAKAGRTIINIQDAHAFLGAQESIASILGTLVNNYDLKVVAVEGSSGYIDTSLLKTFPDKKVRDNAAHDLMKEGRMSAGEFFSITSDKPVALYGIEKDELYRKNLEELGKVCELGKNVTTDISKALKHLKSVAATVYSDELKTVDNNTALYRQGKIPFKRLWDVLAPISAKVNVDPAPYSNLAKLAVLTEKEKSIDFEKANNERKLIVSAISDKLPKGELEIFISGLMEFKKGNISSGDFHSALTNIALKNGIYIGQFNSFLEYTRYIREYESIDLAMISGEMKDYTAAVKERLFKNDHERNLDICIRFMEYAAGLFELQLGNDEFADFLKYMGTLTPGSVRNAAALSPAGKDLGPDVIGDIEGVFNALPKAVDFYKTAEERNRAMLENTIRRMSSEGESVAALITGGYHTNGLTGLLRDKGCSYLVILPKFDASKGERPYITILTNKEKPYERLLATGQYHIATRAYFASDASRTEEQKFNDYSGDFVKALREAVRDIADESKKIEQMTKLVDLWSANYREFYMVFQEEHKGNPVEGFEPKRPEIVEQYLETLLLYSRSTDEIQRHVRSQPFGQKPLAPGKSRVIYVTAEMKGLAQAGGLGDVSVELPEYLNSNGNDVALITPGYDPGAGEDLGISVTVWLGGQEVDLGVRRSRTHGTWVYLLTNPKYFNESGPYGGGDEAMLDRFTLLSLGALELMKALDMKPDVVNASDWYTGLIPFYMRQLPEYREDFRDVAVNLTIHNLEYKGLFNRDRVSTIGAGHPEIARQHMDGGALEYEGRISLLKGGILFADTLNTVGHTYLQDTLKPEVSGGFSGILRARAEAGTYTSILNGLSHSEWDPMSKRGVKYPFNASDAVAWKAANKLDYQKAHGLIEGRDKFVIGFVGRFDYIKGIDLIIADVERLMNDFGGDVEIIMLGPDVGGYTGRLKALAERYKGRLNVRPEFGEPRTIFAASDAVIIPSHYGTEPCNLVQLEAMRYGAVPIVFNTGGLADLITPFDPAAGTGNGFNFDTYTPDAMHGAIASAYNMFKTDNRSWRKLINNGMSFDSTWKKSGEQYEALFRRSSASVKKARSKLSEYSIDELYELYPTLQGGGLNKDHVRRVSEYAGIVAGELGLGEDMVELLKRVGIVHDVSGAYESMATARADGELNRTIERKYGFTSQPKKEEALEALRAFVERRPELAGYVLPDEDKYYMSIARVIAAASEIDGAPLAAWQVDWIASDMSHERHSADMLRSRGIELTPMEEFLIVNHLFYPQDISGYADAASRSGISPEDAKLLLSILIVCDVFENGNNGERLMKQRDIPYQSIRTTFRYIDAKPGLDARPAKVLRDMLSRGDRRIMRLLRESRPMGSTDAVLPGELAFLRNRTYYGARPVKPVSSGDRDLALLIGKDNFYDGVPDPRIGLEVRMLEAGEEFEAERDAPHQEVILVQSGSVRVDVYDGKKVKDTIYLRKGDLVTVFENYRAFVPYGGAKICRLVQKPALDVAVPSRDMVIPRNIGGRDVPEILRAEDGRQLALVLRHAVSAEKYNVITNESFPIGIDFKSPKAGAPAAVPHVNSPIEDPLPELFVVQEGQVRCKVYTKEGVLVRDVSVRAGEMILNLAGHSIEFPEDAKVIEMIVGPYPGLRMAKTPIVDMTSLPVPKKAAVLKPLSLHSPERLLSFYDLPEGENVNRAHAKRVADYAALITSRLGIRRELVDLLRRVASVHDMGGLRKTLEEVAAGRVKGNTELIKRYGIRTKVGRDDTINDLKNLIAGRPELEKYLLEDDPNFEKYYISAARVVAAACALDGNPVSAAKAEEFICEFSHERYSVDRLAEYGVTVTPAEKFLIDSHFFYPESFVGLDSVAATSNMSVDEMKLLLDILIFCDVFENGNNASRLLALRGIDYQNMERTFEMYHHFFGGRGLDPRPERMVRELLAARDPELIAILKDGRPDNSSDAIRPDEFDFLQKEAADNARLQSLELFLKESSGSEISVVTGAAGFIGSHLVDQLLLDGKKVIAVVRSLDQKNTLRLKAVHGDENLHIIAIGDMLDPKDLLYLKKLVDASSVVYHAAGRPEVVVDNFDKALDSVASNALLTALMSELCGRSNKKMVYLSSVTADLRSSVGTRPVSEATPLGLSSQSESALDDAALDFQDYVASYLDGGAASNIAPRDFVKRWAGENGLSTKEAMEERFPEGIYGLSKILGERFVSEMPEGTGITLHLSTIYGSRPRPTDLFKIFIDRLSKGQGIWATDDTRNFLYIEDLVPAIINAGERTFDGNETFILASPGKPTPIKDLAALIMSKFPQYSGPGIASRPAAALRLAPQYDVTKAMRQLSLGVTPLDMGVTATVANITSQHFQAFIDETKTEGKYYSKSGFGVSTAGQSREYSYDDVSGAMEFIRSTRGIRNIDVEFKRSTTNQPVKFTVEVDNELLTLLDSGTHRIDLQKLIEEAIKTRGPDRFRDLEGRTVSIALLERSQSIFEDHTQDNFIGINRILFDRVSPIVSQEIFEMLLAIGITHELSHEVGGTNEGAITRKDIDFVIARVSDGTVDIKPAISVLEAIVTHDSLFLRGLKRVPDATASAIGIGGARAVVNGTENVLANLSEMISRLRQIAKNIAVIEHPELEKFRHELQAALGNPNGVKIDTYITLMGEYNKYMEGDERQKAVRHSLGLGKDERISYFSLEYGLSRWLNIYSGGLGVLSGDTLWAANDRYPQDTFVAMGLAYRTGFFEQHIVTEEDHRNNQYRELPVGSQAQYYRDIPFEKYGDIAKDAAGNDIVIKVESTPGKFIYAKIWHIMVGKVDLYLLDTDIDENDDPGLNPEPNIRRLTHNLYARGRDGNGNILPKEHDSWRFKQELLLGVGGVRALQAIGHKIAALHMNEGHSALSGIELIRQELEARAARLGLTLNDLSAHKVVPKVLVEAGVTFKAAREAVRQKMAFTSHTPIPDGNEEFDIGMFREFFDNYARLNGMDIEDILGISKYESDVYGKYMINLSKLALNLSRYANGVSKKHGEVSRKLYHDESIEHITNAVHRRFWQSTILARKLSETLGKLKHDGAITQDKRISDLGAGELDALLGAISNEELRATLASAREKAIEQLKKSRGVELDKDAFVIVIARRAAPYKRSDLILPKLDMLMQEAERLGIKIQVVFAGKSHPDDDRGKAIIRQINESITRYKGTAFFVENYNIDVAKALTRIASVWLNNPIPPLEASGTSGMKAGFNGVVSLSTPDGWVLEADGAVETLERGDPLSAPGAAVLFNESTLVDPTERDNQTRENMYAALLGLMQEFAQDKEKWTKRSKGVIRDVMLNFTMDRFIQEYENKAYKPSIDLSRSAAAALPIGKPRHISKDDFIKKYSRVYYQNGRFYKQGSTLTTGIYGLLKNTEKLLPHSFPERLRAFFARFIPYFRDAPIRIEVVDDLGTNSVKYIDDEGSVYIVFDRDFVDTLSEHEYYYHGVASHILAERMAHELAHSNKILTREELKKEEVRIILEVDLPLYLKTIARTEFQKSIDKFFADIKRELAQKGREMFHSGRYYGVYGSDKKIGLLKYLASLPPEKARAVAERYVAQFYDGGDMQNGMMALPLDAEELYITDIGTAGTHSMAYREAYTRTRIENDIEGGRFVRVCYKDGEFKIDLSRVGRNASPPDEAFMTKLVGKNGLNKNKELKKYLDMHPEHSRMLAIYLLEPHSTLRSSLHPHLLTVSGKQFEIASSGSNNGTEPAIYMTRDAFTDLDADLLADILRVQFDLAMVRYESWHNKEPFPIGRFKPKVTGMLERIRNQRDVRKELRAVNRRDAKVSKEYIPLSLCNQVVDIWHKAALEMGDFTPTVTNHQRAQKFRDAMAEYDFDSAIKWWGLITNEIFELEDIIRNMPGSARAEKARTLLSLNQIELFNGIATGISSVLNKYIINYGIYNQEGEEYGKAVGTVRVVEDITKLEDAFASAKGDEIWVIPYLPFRRESIPGIGCIVSVAGNRHATDTAKEQAIPLAVVPNAVRLLADFDGKRGMLRVERDGDVRFRLAFPEEEGIPRKKESYHIRLPLARIGSRLSYNLSDIDTNFASFVGQKAANLGELMRAGDINVPEGFALTFTFWQKFREHNNIDAKIDPIREGILKDGRITVSDEELRNRLERIKQVILQGEFPEDLKEELMSSIAPLRVQYGHTGFYVRSSFNFEDLTEKTMAGHYESYPNKHFLDTSSDENLLHAVKLVFASMWNEIAYTARVAEKIDDGHVMPAVVIQVPVKARSAGTMYTAERVSKSFNDISIMASYGQGEGVVGELGKPAEVKVNKSTGEIKIVQEESWVDTRFAFTDGSLGMELVTPEERGEKLLSPEVVASLADLGKRVESIYGYRPQDIEWCIDQEGRIWVVQSRPMRTDKLTAELTVDNEILGVLEAVSEDTMVKLAVAYKDRDVARLLPSLRLDENFIDLENMDFSHTAERMIVARYLAHLSSYPAVIYDISEEVVTSIIKYLSRDASMPRFNMTDICATPGLLRLLRGLMNNTGSDAIRYKIKAFFTEMGEIDTAPYTHMANFEIIRALIDLGKFDQAVAKIRPVSNISEYPDIACNTIRILEMIPDQRAVDALRAFAHCDKMPGWVREFARRAIDNVEEAIKRSAEGDASGLGGSLNNMFAHVVYTIPASIHYHASSENGSFYGFLAVLGIFLGIIIVGGLLYHYYYYSKAKRLKMEALNEYNDRLPAPNKTFCRTFYAIAELADPSKVPSLYAIPALRDIALSARADRVIESWGSRSSVSARALYAMSEHIGSSRLGYMDALKAIIYDAAASKKIVKDGPYRSSLSALALSHMAGQVASIKDGRVVARFISFIEEMALDPSLRDVSVSVTGSTYSLAAFAERTLQLISERAKSKRVRDMAVSAAQALDRRMPGRSDIVVGIPEGVMTSEGIASLSGVIGNAFPGIRVKMVQISTNDPEDPGLLETARNTKAKRGLVLDLPYMLAVSALREYLEDVNNGLAVGDVGNLYTMNSSSLASMSVAGMKDVISSLAGMIPSIAPADVETVKASLEALKPAFRSRTASAAKTITHTESAFLNSFIIGDRTRAVSITTQGMLDSEMLYALRDKIEARQKRQGVASRIEDPVKEIVVITDPEMAGDRAKAARYLDTLGLTPYVEMVMPDELHDVVARLKADGVKNVGIRSREGEIKDYEYLFGEFAGDVVKLELTSDVDTNSYEVLLELFSQSGYWNNIPGVSKDEERNIFRYLPKDLPKDYEEEVRMHREFVKMVLSAA